MSIFTVHCLVNQQMAVVWGVGGTSDLGTFASFHMSNLPGVLGLCSTRLD